MFEACDERQRPFVGGADLGLRERPRTGYRAPVSGSADLPHRVSEP